MSRASTSESQPDAIASGGAVVRLVLVVLVLNLLLTVENIWPTPLVRPGLALAIEVAILVLLVALWTEIAQEVSRGLRMVLAAALLVLVLLRYTDVTALGLLGRPVDLYWETRHLPRLVASLWRVLPDWHVAAAGVAVLTLLGALALGLYALVGQLAMAVSVTGVRRGAAVAAVAVVLAYGGAAWLSGGEPPAFAESGIAHHANDLVAALVPPSAVASAPTQATAPPAPLKARDVYVFFIESYGAVAYDDERFRAPLAGDVAALAENIADAGWAAATTRVVSPVTGGGSWLAHATFLSRQWIDGPWAYDQYTRRAPSGVVKTFDAAGFRTVGVFPGIRGAWPEGDAYGFDSIYDARRLNYRGPPFGWWTIPDQYTLQHLYQREIAHAESAPMFAVFASLASHFPFSPVPPYLPDWDELGRDAMTSLIRAWFGPGVPQEGPQFDRHYVEAMRYNMAWLGGFLLERAPEDAVVVALGDHQPPAIVAGAGVPWHVPVHVFARDAAVIDALEEAGFVPGLQPPDTPLGGMNILPDVLLRALAQ